MADKTILVPWIVQPPHPYTIKTPSIKHPYALYPSQYELSKAINLPKNVPAYSLNHERYQKPNWWPSTDKLTRMLMEKVTLQSGAQSSNIPGRNTLISQERRWQPSAFSQLLLYISPTLHSPTKTVTFHTSGFSHRGKTPQVLTTFPVRSLMVLVKSHSP